MAHFPVRYVTNNHQFLWLFQEPKFIIKPPIRWCGPSLIPTNLDLDHKKPVELLGRPASKPAKHSVSAAKASPKCRKAPKAWKNVGKCVGNLGSTWEISWHLVAFYGDLWITQIQGESVGATFNEFLKNGCPSPKTAIYFGYWSKAMF